MPQETLMQFANEVTKRMPDIMREFLRRQAKEIAQGNISLPQMLILDVLKQKGSQRMGELAHYLSVSMAATTGIVDKLVRKGLAVRASSPQDRRIVNIEITHEGKKMVEKYNHARRKAIVDIFGHLSILDRNTYLEILKKIQSHLKKA